MEQHNVPALISGRQMSLIFEPRMVVGMSDAERARTVMTLARILMQAAGLLAEELGDDER